MKQRRHCRRVLVAACALALLTACAPTTPSPQLTPTMATTLESTTVAPQRILTRRPTEQVTPPASVRATRSEPSPSANDPMSAPNTTSAVPLRLPVAEDFGPNYFELFTNLSKQIPGRRHDGPVSAALVAFGFSERAKLRDERIERDGPLAAVARLTVHPTAESAARLVAEINATASQHLPATVGTVIPLGLKAALTGSRTSSREVATEISANHSKQTGWFVALDGSRATTVVEQWTIVRERTVLTLALVWSGRAHHDWVQALVQRLSQPEPRQAASHAP